ncbi:alpha/beta hydrolase [Synechococcus elongatus PCC 6311]|nr:alpha/beta hydrolase [Synechococcus elongatus PCC 7943]UOW72737.1 alpha/beta hydrolase [Synechococcus elongatus PCC 6311]UOW75458.1 alpha/beta hydrolase [Synechococcus elongatus PCC 6301]
MVVVVLAAHDPIDRFWDWQGQSIRYWQLGDRGAPVLLVHGFGACCEHWRQNVEAIAQHSTVYVIDLLGFGQSAKPDPIAVNYGIELWAQQIEAFRQAVIGQPTRLIANSIGCVVALQAAVDQPEGYAALLLIDCALRQIDDKKLAQQPLGRRLGRPLLKAAVRQRGLSNWLYRQLAKPSIIERILKLAYPSSERIDPALVEALYAATQSPGAAGVFWAFINLFDAPLAEQLLPQVQAPVTFFWGDRDPWEPIALGRQLADFPSVKAFVPLAGLGHCPHDEAPKQVNPQIVAWLQEGVAAAG